MIGQRTYPIGGERRHLAVMTHADRWDAEAVAIDRIAHAFIAAKFGLEQCEVHGSLLVLVLLRVQLVFDSFKLRENRINRAIEGVDCLSKFVTCDVRLSDM